MWDAVITGEQAVGEDAKLRGNWVSGTQKTTPHSAVRKCEYELE
jgi:hypothetical protein